MSTTLRGGQRLDEPEMPGGQIVLQLPPELQEGEGAGGVRRVVALRRRSVRVVRDYGMRRREEAPQYHPAVD